MPATTEEKLIKLLAEEFGRPPETINRETKFWDASGLDAIAAALFMFSSPAFEREFGFTLSFSLFEAGFLRTVGDFADLVEKFAVSGAKGRLSSPGLV